MTDFKLSIEQVARLCHQLNKDYCWLLGDFSASHFDEAPDWQVEAAIQGVRFRLLNPNVTPEQMHQNWLKQKEAEGWVCGTVKDSLNKTHPCCLPYDQLPASQRLKDYLFSAVVGAIAAAGAAPEVV